MRWNLVARAWSLARSKYPDVKRLYVDIPGKFGASGSCNILDLDVPGKPLGAITYDVRPLNGEPRMTLALDAQNETLPLPSIELKASVKTSIRTASNEISAELITKRYPDPEELSTQLAYLIVGHKDGIKEASGGMSRNDVGQWLRSHGFEPSLLDDVCAGIDGLGVRLDGGFNIRQARQVKNHFEQFQRVRIKDELSMEYQECAQVLEVKGSLKDGYWYKVLVDGSESPKWFPEEALDHIHVGWIAEDNKNAI
jgi:hypothetical protein